MRLRSLNQFLFLFITAFIFACGGGKDKSQDTAKKETKSEEKTTAKEEKKNVETKSEEKTTVSKQESTTGTFLRIDQGDYAHLYIKVADGTEMDFWVLKDDKTFNQLMANPDKFKNKKLKVYWEKTKQNIPEAGGEMEIQSYIKSELL